MACNQSPKGFIRRVGGILHNEMDYEIRIVLKKKRCDVPIEFVVKAFTGDGQKNRRAIHGVVAIGFVDRIAVVSMGLIQKQGLRDQKDYYNPDI